ncbi:hypothetical protein AAC387_Pa12g0108 [Persea americana]
MVYDNIGHGADHCFPPPGYKRPKSMKRTDGVGPVGRRTNGRRTVCGKDVRASCCCLCPVQSAPAAAASVRACVRACSRLRRVRSGRACCRCARSCVQLRRPCAVHPVLLQRLFVRAAASAVRACCCSVCSCVQPRRPCALLPLPCAVSPVGAVPSDGRFGARRPVSSTSDVHTFPHRGVAVHFSKSQGPFTPFRSSLQAPSAKRQAPSAKC